MNKTDPAKNTARTIGVLYIIGTVAGILSFVCTGSLVGNPDYLTLVSANEIKIILGALLVLIMGFSLAMVPVLLFPVFKKYNESLALGAVVFRGALEAFSYVAIVICWLLLLTLSRNYVQAGAPEPSCYQIAGTIILAAVDRIGQIMTIIFSLGALMIYTVFYQSKLIPHWLAVWGLVGAVLYFSVPLLSMFDFVWKVLYAPLAVQEMVLAIWLIVKGFNTPAAALKLS